MANEILVDTSGLYALLVADDDRHQKASRILKQSSEKNIRFVVTDYIIDETATLLRARGYTTAAVDLFESILPSKVCTIEWMDFERFSMTKTFFLKHADKAWSFTDCYSFIIMKELRIHDALTKDNHFKAAGFNALLV